MTFLVLNLMFHGRAALQTISVTVALPGESSRVESRKWLEWDQQSAGESKGEKKIATKIMSHVPCTVK